MAKEKKAAAKAAKKNGKAKAEKKPKANKFGADMVILANSLPDENPRHESSKNHGRFDGMVKYMKKHGSATVADVIANTEYRRNDFEWDLEREVFKTKKVTPTPPSA